MNIGHGVKLCRTQKNFTQAALAKKSNIGASYLSQIEKGNKIPNLNVIENIANALGMPLSLLVFISSSPEELESLDKELSEKMSKLILDILKNSDKKDKE